VAVAVKRGKRCYCKVFLRISLFQNTANDKFLPHYNFEHKLPDIPVKAKLFRYRIDYKKPAQYELSSVELNQDFQINVDFDMGMPLDLIDREIYQPDVPTFKPSDRGAEELKKRLDELKLLHLDEKDRFLLSEANVYQTPHKGELAAQNSIMPKKLPSSYRLVHKEEKWGVDTKDNRKIKVTNGNSVGETSIMTMSERTKKRDLRDEAIKQIEKRFVAAKRVKMGMQKPGHPGVVATKVFDFIPNVRLMMNNTALVVCDDQIE
jgi:hypothetical protein